MPAPVMGKRERKAERRQWNGRQNGCGVCVYDLLNAFFYLANTRKEVLITIPPSQ